jgi:hypothetical protein
MLRTVIAFLIEPTGSSKMQFEKRLWLLYKENIEKELFDCVDISCLIERPKKDYELALNLLIKMIYTGKGQVFFENEFIKITFLKNSKVRKGKKFLKLIWNAEDKVWVIL